MGQKLSHLSDKIRRKERTGKLTLLNKEHKYWLASHRNATFLVCMWEIIIFMRNGNGAVKISSGKWHLVEKYSRKHLSECHKEYWHTLIDNFYWISLSELYLYYVKCFGWHPRTSKSKEERPIIYSLESMGSASADSTVCGFLPTSQNTSWTWLEAF